MATDTLTERVQVLVTASEREALEKLAARQDRSMSYVAREAILKHLKGAKG